MSYSLFHAAIFGASKAGLATVGYRLYNADGSANGARVTAGVAERTAGTYGATITMPDAFTGEIRWDTGEGTPAYASAFFAPNDFENLDAKISSRNATTPPTVAAIRSEMDSNSTKLANLDAAVSSRSTYAGADTSGTTTLLSRLTSARAGYLDVLNGLVAAIWAAVTDSSGITTLLARLTSGRASNLDNLDAAISSRNATTPPSAATVAAAVLDQTLSGHTTAGTAGAALNAAGNAGDPWLTPLPGTYATGTAGAIIGGLDEFDRLLLASDYVPSQNPSAIVPAPSDASLCACYITARFSRGSVASNVSFFFTLVTPGDDESYDTKSFAKASDESGLLRVELPRNSTWTVSRGLNGTKVTFAVPDDSVFHLPQILGTP